MTGLVLGMEQLQGSFYLLLLGTLLAALTLLTENVVYYRHKTS